MVVVVVVVVVAVYRFIYLFVCLFICLSICLSLYLSVSLQARERSSSARLPEFLNLIVLKTQQFSEMFLIFELDNVKNEAALREPFFKLITSKTKQFCETSFKNAKLRAELCRADGLVPMCFAIFLLHLFKLLRLPRKTDARSYELLHLSHTKLFQQT